MFSPPGHLSIEYVTNYVITSTIGVPRHPLRGLDQTDHHTFTSMCLLKETPPLNKT